jgi:hypothetical protein
MYTSLTGMQLGEQSDVGEHEILPIRLNLAHDGCQKSTITFQHGSLFSRGAEPKAGM